MAQPLLRWTPIADALQYELEIWTRLPEEAPEGYGPLIKTKQVFQAAYQADFSLWDEEQTLYWRVRALDLDGQPISRFSQSEVLQVNPKNKGLLRPVLNADFNAGGMASLLYPVYTWVMIPGASGYEVELLTAEPENPIGTEASTYRIWSQRVGAVIDCYDELPRSKPAPDVYLAAAAALQVDPARCLVLEDTVTGVTAGVAAGATVLGFAPSGTTGHSAAQALLAAGAVHVLQHLSELPDWCLKNHQKS